MMTTSVAGGDADWDMDKDHEDREDLAGYRSADGNLCRSFPTPRKPLAVTLADEGATAAFGFSLANLLRPGDVVLLSGELGAGKSALARAVIRSYLADPLAEVPSPTFTLVQTYVAGGNTLWHFDLYRLTRAIEILELGWEEALVDGIVLVEWPERLGSATPAEGLAIRLDVRPGSLRVAFCSGGPSWDARLTKLAGTHL